MSANSPVAIASPQAATGALARGFAALVVWLRHVILLGWGVVVVWSFINLPALASASGVATLVPSNAPALRTEATAAQVFGAPLDAQVAVVQRNPHGLSTAAQEAAVQQAVSIDVSHPAGAGISGLLGALPVPNTAGIFPSARERSTTVITFLYFRPGTSITEQVSGGERYASRYASAPDAHLVGVTGPVPAIYAQGQIIGQHLIWVELATVLAIAVIVGYFFLSLGAPVATLLCAGLAYVIAIRVVQFVTVKMHVALPPDVEPVLVVLLLGVTTDYTVFFLSGMRNRLAAGLPRLVAARVTTAEYAPIVLAAGVIVAAGTAVLAASKVQLISAFGPALALTVLTAMVVSVTLAPALIAIFGGLLFLPGPGWYAKAKRVARRALRARGSAPGMAEDQQPDRRHWPLQARLARVATARPIALLIVAGCVLAMLAVGWHARELRLGSPLIAELPANTAVARAGDAAAAGFAPGILSPTEILALGPGVTRQGAALARLEAALSRQRGVAGVVGPANLPTVVGRFNPMLAKSGNAARFGIIQTTDPLGPTAVDQLRALQRKLPELARRAGVTDARFEVGGATAALGEAITATSTSLGKLALIMLALTFILLVLFLRAAIAPLYLLAASVLALLATLGLTVWVFQSRLGYDGIVYYVPFTVAVLLISLGADYNVFIVGRIWEEARRRPLRDAIAVAGTQSAQAVTMAGLALAASFALLAIIPLQQFREVAVAMAAGIIIDAVVARSLLVPALVALFGRVGTWPSPTLRTQRRRPPARGRGALQPLRRRLPDAMRASTASAGADVDPARGGWVDS